MLFLAGLAGVKPLQLIGFDFFVSTSSRFSVSSASGCEPHRALCGVVC
jgi:hypothetical protein